MIKGLDSSVLDSNVLGASVRMAGQGATAGFLNTDWNPRALPTEIVTENFALRTVDSAATTGSLYHRGRAEAADTVVCIMPLGRASARTRYSRRPLRQ